MGQPHISRRTLAVIGFSIHIDAAIFPQLFDLAEGLTVALGINGEGRSAEFFDYRKGRHIARPVGNINHIGKSDAPQSIGHPGIDVDFRMLGYPLIDFKQRPRLGRIVDSVAHFADDLMLFSIKPFNEVTAPDSFDIRHDRRPFDDSRHTGTDDVMLYLDVVLAVLGILFDDTLEILEDFRDAVIILLFLAKSFQLFIIEAFENPILCVLDELIQVNRVRIDFDALLGIARWQGIDMLPKFGLIDMIFLKNRVLHIPINQRLIEIPNHSNNVLHKAHPRFQAIRRKRYLSTPATAGLYRSDSIVSRLRDDNRRHWANLYIHPRAEATGCRFPGRSKPCRLHHWDARNR